MRKSKMVSVLGEQSLLLPEMLQEALTANDRVKFYFSVLQSARYRADHPDTAGVDLSAEREASGVDDDALDVIVAGATTTPDGSYRISGVAEVQARIVAAIKQMITPLQLHTGNGLAERYTERLQTLLGALPPITDETVGRGYISAVTRARRDREDSLHLLVMDLHKDLNQLQAEICGETIDGARVYDIIDEDRPLISAFMAGLNATAPLKFEHPGLETFATRAGGTLVIQNDIGTTDAHVLLVKVSACTATLIYTDIHVERARFFTQLFERFELDWEDTLSRPAEGLEDADTYFACVGRYRADDMDTLASYLEYLGSRIVFLIDWNKARKRLRNFLKKRDSIAVLKWAADNDFGHRAFLQVGGERLIYEVLETTGGIPMRLGDRLDKVLGGEAAAEFMKFVLKTASIGLLAGRSQRLILDEVKAELLNYFQTARQGVLGLASDHAALIADLAGTVRDALMRAPHANYLGLMDRSARRAKLWETRADDLLNEARTTAQRAVETTFVQTLIERADDAADNLEETAYLLTLLPNTPVPAGLWGPLQTLANHVVEAAHEYVICVETAGLVERGGVREDTQDFLEAVDRIVTLEHQTDDAEREFTTALLTSAADNRELFLFGRIAQALEEATDVISHCGLILREELFAEVVVA